MSWVELGVSDPREPQAFLPVSDGASSQLLLPGDILAARCLMVLDTDTGGPVMQDSVVTNRFNQFL